MNEQTPNQRNSGFTVIELLAVLGLMMIIVAIATPAFYFWLPTLRLSSAARQVATDLQLARMKAISQNTKYRLNFTSATQYSFEKDNGGFATESGPFSLPDGITVTPTGTTSEFQPRGTANATDTIELTNDSNKKKWVCVKVVGRVNIQDSICS